MEAVVEAAPGASNFQVGVASENDGVLNLKLGTFYFEVKERSLL